MNRTKKAGLSVKSGLSLMCIVCLLCGLLCGFFWLAGENSALAAGPDGSALAAKAVVSGDASLAAPERGEKLAVQAAAQATSPVVRTVAVGMDAGDYTETVACDYTPVYVDDRFGGYCYVLDDAVWLPADAFAEMLGHESDTVTDGDTETVTDDGADITATYGAMYYTANGRCFYAPDGVYALDGEVVLPLADLEKIFGVTAAFSADHTSLRVDASEQALLESGESYYGARDVYWLSHIINAEAGNQPMDGQIAVGNVVLNRVADERFPNSVKEVVFDRRGGVAQFSPTADGRISLTPDEDAELAAKLAFEGYARAVFRGVTRHGDPVAASARPVPGLLPAGAVGACSLLLEEKAASLARRMRWKGRGFSHSRRPCRPCPPGAGRAGENVIRWP